MVKKTYEAFANWCADESVTLCQLLGLTQYKIEVITEPDESQCPPECCFSIACEHPYQVATLFWNESTFTWWCKQNRINLRRYLLHEMLHILVKPLQRLAEERYVSNREVTDATEELVDHLANIMSAYLVK